MLAGLPFLLHSNVPSKTMSAMMKTYVALGQQPRAELQVIIQVKGPPSLVLLSEGCNRGGFSQFLHAPDTTELLV